MPFMTARGKPGDIFPRAHHWTKDKLHAKQLLGCRSVNSTMTYTHPLNFEGEEHHARVAKTCARAEACSLVEEGFD